MRIRPPSPCGPDSGSTLFSGLRGDSEAPGSSCVLLTASGIGWDMVAAAEGAAASTPRTSCSPRSPGPGRPSECQLQSEGGAQGGRGQCMHPAPCRAQWVTPIRGISDLLLHLKKRDPGQVKTSCQWQRQLNSRVVPRGEGGAGGRLEGHPSLSLTSSLPGGTVSKATCSSTSGSLKMPWRRAHCPVSWTPSLRRSGRR